MRTLWLIAILFLVCLPASAADWFATATGGNIDAANLWVPTSTGSCTGSGTALVWANRAAGDRFVANGCANIILNVDPGVSGSLVTLDNSQGTAGGQFTCATATGPAAITANVTAGSTTTPAVAISGSSGTNCGFAGSGNITGGGAAAGNGVTDTHTVTTLTHALGTVTGGTNATARGYQFSGATGSVAITGNGTGATADGIVLSGSGSMSVTGTCTAHITNQTAGCNATSTGKLTLTGKSINGFRIAGAANSIVYTPAAGDYICYPKDASYAIGTEDCTHTGGGAGLSSHATEVALIPAAGDVKTGVTVGTVTGTHTGGVNSGSAH